MRTCGASARMAAAHLCVVAWCTSTAWAAEPNETFAARSMLAPGVLTVSDLLTPGTADAPDTVLGIRGTFGEITQFDDQGSPYGDGNASGLFNVPTNSGAIAFDVSGWPDEGFFGNHDQFGSYDVYIDVYDVFDDPIASFGERGQLQPGMVDAYAYSNFEWIGGYYDVYIENVIGEGGDVDFFTFTGLAPGTAFTAVTKDPSASGVDTMLGWFDSTGALIAFDDDGGGDLMSKIEGITPADGMLTFAVSGYGDWDFNSAHLDGGAYQLQLIATLAPTLTADFNSSGTVDGADLIAWKGGFGTTGAPTRAQGNADGDGDVDGADFLTWQRQLGSGPAAGAGVPEPGSAWLAIAVGAALTAVGRRRFAQ